MDAAALSVFLAELVPDDEQKDLDARLRATEQALKDDEERRANLKEQATREQDAIRSDLEHLERGPNAELMTAEQKRAVLRERVGQRKRSADLLQHDADDSHTSAVDEDDAPPAAEELPEAVKLWKRLRPHAQQLGLDVAYTVHFVQLQAKIDADKERNEALRDISSTLGDIERNLSDLKTDTDSGLANLETTLNNVDNTLHSVGTKLCDSIESVCESITELAPNEPRYRNLGS